MSGSYKNVTQMITVSAILIENLNLKSLLHDRPTYPF